MMCSPTAFVLILIGTLISNCLHFGCGVQTSNCNNNNINNANTNNLNVSNSSWYNSKNIKHKRNNNIILSHNHDVSELHSSGAINDHDDRNVNNSKRTKRSGKSNNNHSSVDNAASSSNTIGGRLLRIDITRKYTVHVNGVEVDEKSLADHLEEHEKYLIFGKIKAGRPLKFVHLQHLTDANNENNGKKKQTQYEQQKQHKLTHRVKRSDTTNAGNIERQNGSSQPQMKTQTSSQNEEIVSVQIKDNEQSVHLQLRQTPKLIDDAFVFIRRYANSTQFIENSHKLAERYERCFYSNENSALDLCDDENVRGVFHHNSTNYIIHPLPARFGNSTHVILESNYHLPPSDPKTSVFQPLEATTFNKSLYFEPEQEDYESTEEIYSQQAYDSNYEPYDRLYKETTHNYKNHHNERSGRPTKYVDLNLRYKPRYHHNNEQQQQQQHRQHHHIHLKHNHRQQINKHMLDKLNKHQRKKKSLHHHHKALQSEQLLSSLQHNNDAIYNSNNSDNEAHSNNNVQHDDHQQQHDFHRHRRYITSGNSKIPQDLFIETAIFVDRDLFKHMSKNFPDNTESQMMRFVLAMINAVQLLYHDRSLGRRINFVLKRLEILYVDPPTLRRSDDIDTYLSNFCEWQQRLNPPQDSDTMHYDHAVILTGLDLYVVDKNGKKISQVVGLAPVAGMCTNTSSCTINEGKHFESVFVVAHEIGHNLGMRHDTVSERNCDPTRYIMSPTLGSGKTTWSDCSRDYLDKFLAKGLGSCLFDHGQFANNLDHAAEGILPGERFDADQQCMLKYGRNSLRAKNQKQSDICTDLHCQRERYTWTSHPALEGTECGKDMWCRSGTCVMRPAVQEPYHLTKSIASIGKVGYDKGHFLESSKMGQLLHEHSYNKAVSWSEWSEGSDCASGCLYGPSRRLLEGSTGLRTYSRRCIDHRKRCLGRDHKYEACVAKECYSLKTVETISDFANDKCSRARKLDAELTGEGVQIIGDMEESCKIFCRTKSNGTKMRRWPFPDGTTCRSRLYKPEDISFCVDGRCEKFSCDNSTQNYYKLDPHFCQQRKPPPKRTEAEESRRYNSVLNENDSAASGGGIRGNYKTYNSNNNLGIYKIYAPTTYRSKYENEAALRSFHGQERDPPYKRKSDNYQPWNKFNYSLRDTAQPVSQPQPAKPPPPVSASLVAIDTAVASESEWIVKSGCHSSCMAKSKGIQVVTSRNTGANNIQLCTHNAKPCERLLSATEHAEHTCARYKLKVRGLSGYGTQIAASVDEPDRSCRVGCQDEFIKYRFYLVNGRYGHFPLGTKCSNNEERYCVNGKCLEFGADNIPLEQSHISLALFRSRRSLAALKLMAKEKKNVKHVIRNRRSYLSFDPVNTTETITQDFINNIVKSIMDIEKKPMGDEFITHEHIEFNNPIHLTTDELTK